MDGPQPKKKSADIINSNNDYITNLPVEIKDIILMKLSIKEAVRTSVLSSKWKYSWTSIPNLVFEGDMRCKVPLRFFACSALKSVKLSDCIIIVPRFFNGFALLHTLKLHNFLLPEFGIEKLVSSCPLLDCLSLSSFCRLGCLKISAPNVTSLDICGKFYDLCLETPKLTFASINLEASHGYYLRFNVPKDGMESNITRTVGRLSNIQQLRVCGVFVDFLATGPIPVKLPTIFNHLKEICLDIDCSKQNEGAALCLFQSAPNIQVLHIEFNDNKVEDQLHVQPLWELKAIKDCLFKRLEVVTMLYMGETELSLWSGMSMLGFAKFVLSTAPALENLNIIGLEKLLTILSVDEKLNNFPKLSTKADILFLEWEEWLEYWEECLA